MKKIECEKSVLYLPPQILRFDLHCQDWNTSAVSSDLLGLIQSSADMFGYQEVIVMNYKESHKMCQHL